MSALGITKKSLKKFDKKQLKEYYKIEKKHLSDLEYIKKDFEKQLKKLIKEFENTNNSIKEQIKLLDEFEKILK